MRTFLSLLIFLCKINEYNDSTEYGRDSILLTKEIFLLNLYTLSGNSFLKTSEAVYFLYLKTS